MSRRKNSCNRKHSVCDQCGGFQSDDEFSESSDFSEFSDHFSDHEDKCHENKCHETKIINCRPNIIVHRPKIIRCKPTIIKYKPEIIERRPKTIKWYEPTVVHCESKTKKIGCKPRIRCD